LSALVSATLNQRSLSEAEMSVEKNLHRVVRRTLSSLISLRRFGKGKKTSGEGKDRCMSTSSTKKATAKKPDTLSHYTQFPILLDILLQKRIVFGNPDNWDDKTDSRILKKYADVMEENVGVLCLTEFPEGIYDNILHWKIYAPGKSGCRIDFDREILERIVKQQGATLEKIYYLNTEELESKPEKWYKKPPFLKRSPYTYEHEWRILKFGKLEKDSYFKLDISKCFTKIIKGIRLSPELPKNVAKNLRPFLESKCKRKCVRSWISENPDWEQRIIKSLTQQSAKSSNREK